MSIRLSMMVAKASNNVIGRDNKLPWYLPNDLKYFKQVTFGKPVIMGRKTWESLPRRPLPGRLNIVITRQSGYQADGATVAGNLGDALAAAFSRADEDRVDEVCVIGGAQIYMAALELADRLYLTDVDAAPDGDSRLPEIDESVWTEVRREVHPAGEGDDHAFVFRRLDRI